MNNGKTIRLYIRFGIKLILFIVLVLVWCNLTFGTILSQVPGETEVYRESDAHLISLCDEAYYEMDYEYLFELLCTYNAKTCSEQFDKYREVLDAYVAVQEYEKWEKISEVDMPEARKMQEMYYNRIMEIYENCRFPQNQKHIDDFVEAMDK